MGDQALANAETVQDFQLRFDQQMPREPSPMRSASSMSTTGTCRNARSMAAASPTGPAPATATGWRTTVRASWSRARR
jgi:hypothetical protein